MHRALRQVTETHEPGTGWVPGEEITPEMEMQVQVQTEIFGSAEVTQAAKDFFATIRTFDHHARMRDYASARSEHAGVREAQREMNKYRDEASDQVRRVEVMMRDELANL